ncbi:hypothetical protein DOQ08_01476 [Marinobacter litoralis]|uniref:Uncharacterized protein n=1 Tax=Marinobacter litoralis TaxID=187981 RepID=A0A3M2RFR2_9GAMM|nr:hypothetical protein DOQ08_01476 [Marinobacter litoralis]
MESVLFFSLFGNYSPVDNSILDENLKNDS